jgi:hypothetical protein
MRKRTIEELLEETGSLVLLKDIRKWVDGAFGNPCVSCYSSYKAAVIRAEERCIKIYVINELNEHKEIVFRRRDIVVEERADPTLIIKGNPLVVREIESNRSAKAKNMHGRKMLKKMGLSATDLKKIEYDKMFELPTVGLINKEAKYKIVKAG